MKSEPRILPSVVYMDCVYHTKQINPPIFLLTDLKYVNLLYINRSLYYCKKYQTPSCLYLYDLVFGSGLSSKSSSEYI